MGNYVLVGTTDIDKNIMPKTLGAINRGFYHIGKDGTMSYVVISVDDIEKHMEIIKKKAEKY